MIVKRKLNSTKGMQSASWETLCRWRQQPFPLLHEGRKNSELFNSQESSTSSGHGADCSLDDLELLQSVLMTFFATHLSLDFIWCFAWSSKYRLIRWSLVLDSWCSEIWTSLCLLLNNWKLHGDPRKILPWFCSASFSSPSLHFAGEANKGQGCLFYVGKVQNFKWLLTTDMEWASFYTFSQLYPTNWLVAK